jgi:hypothetical protein
VNVPPCPRSSESLRGNNWDKRDSDVRGCPGLPGQAITVRAAYRIEPRTRPLLREGSVTLAPGDHEGP